MKKLIMALLVMAAAADLNIYGQFSKSTVKNAAAAKDITIGTDEFLRAVHSNIGPRKKSNGSHATQKGYKVRWHRGHGKSEAVVKTPNGKVDGGVFLREGGGSYADVRRQNGDNAELVQESGDTVIDVTQIGGNTIDVIATGTKVNLSKKPGHDQAKVVTTSTTIDVTQNNGNTNNVATTSTKDYFSKGEAEVTVTGTTTDVTEINGTTNDVTTTSTVNDVNGKTTVVPTSTTN
jgi:hypothetical protein